MSDIFQEIDEDLRRDRFTQLWKIYRYPIMAGMAAVIVGTAGMVGWREYQDRRNAAQADAFLRAMDQAQRNDADAAKAALGQLARDGGAGYATLARLQQAALLAKGGDNAGAVRVYDEIAADGRVEQGLRDLASILAVQHLVDSADPGELMKRLEPLARDKNPWRHSAMEMQALAAKRAGDTAKAKEIYTKLADDLSAPQGLRARAAEMLAILGG